MQVSFSCVADAIRRVPSSKQLESMVVTSRLGAQSIPIFPTDVADDLLGDEDFFAEVSDTLFSTFNNALNSSTQSQFYMYYVQLYAC